MSVLAIQLPPRERLSARAAGFEGAAAATGGLRLPGEWGFAYSADGRSLSQSGSAALALLPRADHVLLVLADTDVSWHRVEIPRAPPARLRAALLGVMEDGLLDDDAALHFALAPGAVPGQPGWVAVTHRPRLAAALAALETGSLSVERVVCAAQPGVSARGHFFAAAADADEAVWLSLSRPDAALCVRLSGALARTLQPGEGVRWTATPAAAVAAEAWLGAPVALLSDAERALESAQQPGNLRQFDLAPQLRGTRALRGVARRLLSDEWRPVRAGIAALALVQLLGLNAYAWQQRDAIATRRATMDALLRQAFPGVRAVLDAPLQMQRESDRLRAAAGRPGDADLEVLMGAAANAWPDGLAPVQTLRFEPGRLTLAAGALAEPQIAQLRERLRSAGFDVEFAEGRITIARATLAAPGVAGRRSPA